MKVKLQSVVSTGTEWDVTEHGSLRSNLEKGETVFFSRKNLESNKRVVVFIQKGDDKPLSVSCSERLSNTVRKALAAKASTKQILRNLLENNIIENSEGIFYLIPEGVVSEKFNVSELTKESVVAFEDLI